MAKKRICAMGESFETQAELAYIQEIARALAMHTDVWDVWEDLAYQLNDFGCELRMTQAMVGSPSPPLVQQSAAGGRRHNRANGFWESPSFPMFTPGMIID